MAQLVVRNVPDDVKARLKRRAKLHGRSLEAEVREILSSIPEPAKSEGMKGVSIGTLLAQRQRALGISQDDMDALDRNIAELRSEWKIRDLKLDK